jgi:hypothetical protein
MLLLQEASAFVPRFSERVLDGVYHNINISKQHAVSGLRRSAVHAVHGGVNTYLKHGYTVPDLMLFHTAHKRQRHEAVTYKIYTHVCPTLLTKRSI